MAPLTERVDDGLHSEGSGDKDTIQDLFNRVLKDAMLSDTDNVKKIADRFNLTQYEQILCIGVKYVITCTGCDIETSTFNCSSGYNFKQIWLSFDPNTTSGSYLLQYAVLNWEVLGLDWQGACNLSEEAYLTLNINVSSTIARFLCGVNAETYINSSLKELTAQVSVMAK